MCRSTPGPGEDGGNRTRSRLGLFVLYLLVQARPSWTHRHHRSRPLEGRPYHHVPSSLRRTQSCGSLGSGLRRGTWRPSIRGHSNPQPASQVRASQIYGGSPRRSICRAGVSRAGIAAAGPDCLPSSWDADRNITPGSATQSGGMGPSRLHARWGRSASRGRVKGGGITVLPLTLFSAYCS